MTLKETLDSYCPGLGALYDAPWPDDDARREALTPVAQKLKTLRASPTEEQVYYVHVLILSVAHRCSQDGLIWDSVCYLLIAARAKDTMDAVGLVAQAVTHHARVHPESLADLVRLFTTGIKE